MIPGLKAESLKRIAEFRTQRYGVVVDVFIKTTKTSSRRTINNKFVKVLWDGRQTPSEHAQMRLVHEREFEELMEDYRNAIGG